MKIKELRILPPLAIGRLGSSDQPMDNFTLADNPEDPLDFRVLQAAPTFRIDEKTGEIAEKFTPKELRFKSVQGTQEHIHPVAPFLEVFAVTDENKLVPLTVKLLKEVGLSPKDVCWKIEVANRKVTRRTGDKNDAVEANLDWFSDHKSQGLLGKSKNFISKEVSIHFGTVRYIKPNSEFPEIRLRFTPAKGLIYGPKRSPQQIADDAENPAVADLKRFDNLDVYEVPSERSIYDASGKKGKWYNFEVPFGIDNSDPYYDGKFVNETFPSSLYAIKPPAPCWLNSNIAISRGYFDDVCDGIVTVRITPKGGKSLEARARITSSPPAVVPDTLFIRTLADDLDQVIFGPRVGELQDADSSTESGQEAAEAEIRARALEIVRRAFETVRFLNVSVMNGNAFKGRDPLDFDTMPAEEAYDTDRLMRPVVPERTADTLMIQALHQQVFAALKSGTAPWFARMLRRPDQVADFTDHGRRKMPAMMCGADGSYLALTWRQISTIETAATLASGPIAKIPCESTQPENLWQEKLTPRNLSAQLNYVAAGNPISSRPVTSVGNCTPGLEVDFRAVWRRLFKGIELREWDNLVIDASPGLEHLIGHRLLKVNGKLMMTQMVGPSPAGIDTDSTILSTAANPWAVAPLEWSNNLADVLHAYQGKSVECVFTSQRVGVQQAWWDEKHKDAYIKEELTLRHFFEKESVVIAPQLAAPGELTQGLCSPWQNDYRECSCYYWAGARPDYVNVEPTPSGASRGDNWMQKERTGDYVPDDYVDRRLLYYDDLFTDWERYFRFQVKGRDVPHNQTPLTPAPKTKGLPEVSSLEEGPASKKSGSPRKKRK